MAEVGLTLSKRPQVISLDPELLGDVLEDIRRLERATGKDALAESVPADRRFALILLLRERSKRRIDPKFSSLSGLILSCEVVTGWWKWWKEPAVKVVLAPKKRGHSALIGSR